MQAATAALRHGVGPEYLKITNPVEQAVVDELIQMAEDERAKRDKLFLDNIEITIHNAIVKAFKK